MMMIKISDQYRYNDSLNLEIPRSTDERVVMRGALHYYTVQSGEAAAITGLNIIVFKLVYILYIIWL